MLEKKLLDLDKEANSAEIKKGVESIWRGMRKNKITNTLNERKET